MELKLYINNQWHDFSNNIVNEINEDERIDEVLDSGQLTIQTRDIKHNIAPNTLCRLDGIYYLAKSTCNLVIPSDGIYNHDITLIESTYALLQTLINEKALSNRGAYRTIESKANILIAIANQHNDLLYGVGVLNFTIDNSNLPYLEREFNIGRGTSLFHALLEIGKSVNCIPYVSSVDVNGINRVYHISWLNLKANANTDYIVPETHLLKFEMNQDQEQYTKVLETHIDNVVDRDTINKVSNLTVTSNDAIVNADNAILKLPGNAEEITRFEINLSENDGWQPRLRIDIYTAFTEEELDSMMYVDNTLANWMNHSIIGGYVTTGVIAYENKYGTTLPRSATFNFRFEPAEANGNYYSIICYQYDGDITFDISNYILEKAQWELLEAHNKPKYAVYTSGGNEIENLYSYYKNDIWNQILGYDVPPFIGFALSEDYLSYDYYNDILVKTIVKPYMDGSGTRNPLNYSFNLWYKPIVSTYIKSTNNVIVPNEDYIVPSSRSFEVSAAYGDFNLIQQSINKNNEMLGKPEITLEIQANEALLESLELGKRVKITSETHKDLEYLLRVYPYYIISIQKRSIVLGDTANTSVYLNLVNSYSKVAEIIGVDSQYESTKNALTGIIERIVYCGKYDYGFYGTENMKPTGILIKQSTQDDDAYIYVRGTINEYNGDNYLTVKAIDQYAIASGIRANAALTSGNFENYQYPYGDEYNECDSYDIRIARELSLTLGQAQDYPIGALDRLSYRMPVITIKSYKDSREKLIFVFKYYYKGYDQPEEEN